MKPFSEEVLERFAETIKALLHPSVYERTLQEIGASLARAVTSQVPRSPNTASSSALTDYLRFGEWMKALWGWDHTMTKGTEHRIEVHCHTCPFETLAKEDSLICRIEASLLGELARESFGYGKVAVYRGAGHPPRDCRFTVYAERTADNLAAEGLTFVSTQNGDKRKADTTAAARVLTQLTPRERQLVALLAEGLPDKQIAKALRLSVRTVEGHLARIRGKTGLHSRSALIRFALRASAQ
ncbi:MAG: LuxR C-terminal-related transcriptional regulator [Nitrospira sp.]|nr:LuxR C-terminal-related transcriptional regulator [Nitrospira sp.]